MHLHMVEFDGITFGMEVDGNDPDFRSLKKNAFYGAVQLYPNQIMKRMCVRAQDLAAVMGDAGWLVSEKEAMKTVQWDDSPVYYVIYNDEVFPEVKTCSTCEHGTDNSGYCLDCQMNSRWSRKESK